MSTESPIRWGILGTGQIATAFAEGLATARLGTLAAVASRDQAKARAFVDAKVPAAARRGDRVAAHGSYEALLADPGVDAVYVSTPHPEHARWTVAAARAGRHVLCEKPLGVTAAEAEQMIAAARHYRVFLMEAFMYRCHPQTAKILELIRAGAIGQVRIIHASFSFHAPFDPGSRLYAKELAGGGILDVGCYPVSMARLIAGAATGRPFAEPVADPKTGLPAVYAAGHVGRTGVDEYAAAVIKFPGDVIAQVACGVAVEVESDLRVYGTKGHLYVPKPWVPARQGGEAEIFVHPANGAPTAAPEPPRRVAVSTDQQIYGLESDVAAAAIARLRAAGSSADDSLLQAPAPAMTWDDTLGNLRALDAWRAAL